jgi:hypothetical protein
MENNRMTVLPGATPTASVLEFTRPIQFANQFELLARSGDSG